MKILYLCSDSGIPVLGRKGASIHVRSVVAALTRAGHQVVLAAPVLNKSPWERPAEIEGLVLQIRPNAGLVAAVQALKEFNQTIQAESPLPGELRRILVNKELIDELRRRFDSDPPDIIYERAALHAIAGAALAREFQVPLLVELNAPLTGEQAMYRSAELEELAERAERWVLAQADAVLVVSTTLRQHAVDFGVSPEGIHVLPNAVDPELFHPGPADPAVRAHWGLGKGPVLGFVGGLRPWHGVEVLPELLARVRQSFHDAQMVIIGEGQMRRELEARFAERGLASKVVFAGALPHEQVPTVVRQFDVALAPYPLLDHAFYFSPLKLFEYMACGVAVVAASLGQIAETVRDGETGLLYPAGDFEALVSACERVLGNPSQRLLLGQVAARHVLTHHTWEQNALRIVELARGLIAARKTRPQ